MSFIEKAAVASSALTLAALPFAADAAVVRVNQTISLHASSLFPGDPAINFISWDIDGNGGADFYLAGYLSTGSTQFGNSTWLRYQYGAFGIVN